MLVLFTLVLGNTLCMLPVAQAADSSRARPLIDTIGKEITESEVVVDGVPLFLVRGVRAIPAEDRANDIQQRILMLAQDPQVDPEDAEIVLEEDRVTVKIADVEVVTFIPEEAVLENVGLAVLAEANLGAVQRAIKLYREERQAGVLAEKAVWATALTLIAILLLLTIFRVFRWLTDFFNRRAKGSIEKLEEASQKAIDAQQMWRWLVGVLRVLRIITATVLLLAWLETVLGLFPWTRSLARRIFSLVVDPLSSMVNGVVESLPDLVFLLVLYFVVRFILQATRVYFEGVERGRVKLQGFDADWASPTYRLLRMLILAFSIVIAYPYIPGSSSDAFKGVSLLLGLVFSLGSSSFVSNIIAGYSLTYRRAYRIGDRVRIGDIVGDVTDMRVMVTHLRSVKNEDINIPNSVVISSAVTNYSALQKDPGLILHTDVTIGYDTPWRQVEAMLMMAAERTEGLQKEPAPFVLQKSLGDFAVVYELNAFCKDASSMQTLYSRMHANIQDTFNQYGVQIMSPAYEQDPGAPKVVPPESWYAEPAARE